MSASLPDPTIAARIAALRAEAEELERQQAAAIAQPASEPLPRWLTAKEVAGILGLSKQHVYDLMAAGILPSIRIPSTTSPTGRAVRCPEDELRAWMERQRQEQAPGITPFPRVSRAPARRDKTRSSGAGPGVSSEPSARRL